MKGSRFVRVDGGRWGAVVPVPDATMVGDDRGRLMVMVARCMLSHGMSRNRALCVVHAVGRECCDPMAEWREVEAAVGEVYGKGGE